MAWRIFHTNYSDLFQIVFHHCYYYPFCKVLFLKPLKLTLKKTTGTSKPGGISWHSFYLEVRKNPKNSKTLLWAQLGCSACTHVGGSSTWAGPISLLGCLLVMLQLGKQREAADLLEAPLGWSRISASGSLEFLALGPHKPGTGQVEKLRHTMGFLSLDIPQGHHWYSAPGLPSAKLDSGCSLLFDSISYKATAVQGQAAPPPALSELSTCTLGGDLHFI